MSVFAYVHVCIHTHGTILCKAQLVGTCVGVCFDGCVLIGTRLQSKGDTNYLKHSLVKTQLITVPLQNKAQGPKAKSECFIP